MNIIRPLSGSTIAFLCVVFFARPGLTTPSSRPTILELARDHFAPRQLTEAEERLLVLTEKGEVASMLSQNEEDNNPLLASTWPERRTLHADVLVWLCTDVEASAKITYRGVRFHGMRVEGNVELSEARLNFSIFAVKCAFEAIRLSGARMRWLGLNGCVVEGLTARRAQFEADVSLAEGFVARGPVYLASASISGDLFCVNGQFEQLNAEEAKIEGSVLLKRSRFKEVNLLAATVGESLECDGAQLINPGATALTAERATIKGNVSFGNRSRLPSQPAVAEAEPFHADGQVNLIGAMIHGNLECYATHLTHPAANRPLFLADGARITGRIFLGRDFYCDGVVALRGVEAAYLHWAVVETTGQTVIDLQSAKVGAVLSDKLTWVQPGNLFLDGFVYSRLFGAAEGDTHHLLKWLSLQPQSRFHPQPFEQLAAVLKSAGYEKEARTIMLAKNRQHRQFTQAFRGDWWWYNVFGRFIGYGYQPLRAFLFSVGMIVFGWLLFRRAYASEIMTPAKEGGYEKNAGQLDSADAPPRFSETYPRFNAFVFSLESFIPLLRLDQSANWAPNAYHGASLRFGKSELTTGQFVRGYLWIHIISGWILTSLWVGSITGLVKT